ncbi:TonB-dependent receptor [candidate division KSB1 bacterium]|nr:TonB-dependent receptor [candidate division KSB1 bacterium]
MLKKLLLFVFCLLFLPVLLFGGTSGKIAGTVIDKETKEVLPGANISIVGTTMGASSDVKGNFVILNVPVGTYSVKASFIGYQQVTISNLRVNLDLTTDIKFELPLEALVGEAVEIVAERPLINKNATNANQIVVAEDIKNLPMRSYADIVALQAGVVKIGDDIFVRGGRRDEAALYVDGILQDNIFRADVKTGDVITNSIEEISYQAGGYNAEYGFANAGIVNTTTKTGTSQYSIQGETITDEILSLTEKNLGTYSYGYNVYNFAFSGPVPFLANKVKFYLAAERRFMRDGSPSAQPYMNLITNAQGIPLDIEGNPIAFSERNSKLYQFKEQGFWPDNSAAEWHWNGNVKIDILKGISLRLGGNSSRYTQRQMIGTATPDQPLPPFRVGLGFMLFNSDRNEKWLQTIDSYSAKLVHALAPTTFYTATVSWHRNSLELGDPIWWDDVESLGNRNKNPQLASNGTNLPRSQWAFDLYDSLGTVCQRYARDKTDFWGGKFDITHQQGRTHELKAGFDYRYYTVRFYNIGGYGAADAVKLAQFLQTTTRETAYRAVYANNIGYDLFGESKLNEGLNGAKHPVLAAAYLQDKIELKDLVLNLGLRWDYFTPKTKGLHDPNNILMVSSLIDETDANWDWIPAHSYFSPRIGFAFPVTEKTVFHAQYGKFMQQPELRRLYISTNILASYINAGNYVQIQNPDLNPVRTTSYEIGFRQQIGLNASLDITGYYKEIQDQIQINQRNIARPIPYAAFQNGDFGSAKGLSFSFNMRRTERVTALANYTLQWATSTGSTDLTNFNIAWQQGHFPTYVAPTNFDQRHTGSVSFDFRTNPDDGPTWLGGKPLGKIGINMLYTFGSGFSYTPTRFQTRIWPGTSGFIPVAQVGSSYGPWISSLDIKIDKTFQINPVQFNVYLWVINALNSKNEIYVYDATGEADNDGYLDTAEGQTWARQNGPNAVTLYKMMLADPGNYGSPRQIRVGVNFEL